MSKLDQKDGALMASEISEAAEVFIRSALTDYKSALAGLDLDKLAAFYTVARGSSDAAANVVAYEAMRELKKPVTTLPPSIFSIGNGVSLRDSGVMLISQSGASEDLILSAKGVKSHGGKLVAITNRPGSPIEAIADLTIPIAAGEELAVPATKTVIGSIAAGIALISALSENYAERTRRSVAIFQEAKGKSHPKLAALRKGMLDNEHIYVVGRDVGLGLAQEIALKIKETCAIHAEAYSSSEVLHGPLQLATRSMFILMLDTGQPEFSDSLNNAEARFNDLGVSIVRMKISDVADDLMTPASAAALLLSNVYSTILSVALALGFNPDKPSTLSKMTITR